MIEVSIIMGHYSEDEKREEIARSCIKAVQPHRNETTEFILGFNGHYPYRDEFIKYCDQWHERDADTSSGRSQNISVKMARGNILFFMSNDDFLYSGAVAECVRLLKKYKKYIITCSPVSEYKITLWGKQLEDGYMGCWRAGDNISCLTKEQWNDVGPADEIDPWTDGINLVNRRIAKGYIVMLTKKPLSKNLAQGKHCFLKQQKEFGYMGYKSKVPIYSREKLYKLSYGRPLDPNSK